MVVKTTASVYDDPYLTEIMDSSAGMSSFNEQILQSQRPNFFELLAQEAMHEALRPAFQYVCKVREKSQYRGAHQSYPR